jgi:uncharacterized protein (TIGR00375 family)
MEIIADLHLHSKYSRAVSPQMIIPQISLWAGRKGIGLLGTGDFTHPLWFRELKENLQEVGDGLYQSNKEVPQSGTKPFFIFSAEIASIYSQGGKSHRIHNVVLAPNFKTVEEINDNLRKRGVNLMSDGRPITGLSSQHICEIVFSVSKDCLIIPAHVWTPWYSLYGSNSGFDSLQECFGDFSSQIYGIETGLSSDPGMNWRIEELDKRSILSFSDAHSPQKLGREATIFDLKEQFQSYEQVKQAIINQQIAYTIEFYPEEGKYHWTGHRLCNVKHSPEQTVKLGTICPVCGKKLTVGVMHRVEELSSRSSQEVIGDRNHLIKSQNGRPPYFMSVPLLEIIAEVLKTNVASQAVMGQYLQMITAFGSEFDILLKTPIEFIDKNFGEETALAIDKVRKGEIYVDPGYDGVFGIVKISSNKKEDEKPDKKEQMSLF